MYMKFSACLMKRNNKVNISIHVKKKLIRQNIYSTSSNEIIYQEVIRCLSIDEAVRSYYDEIYKFSHLGYRMIPKNSVGKVLQLKNYKEPVLSDNLS